MIDRLPSTDDVEAFWKLKPVFDGYFSSRDGATEHRWRQELGRPADRWVRLLPRRARNLGRRLTGWGFVAYVKGRKYDT